MQMKFIEEYDQGKEFPTSDKSAFAVMIMKLVDQKFNRQQGHQPIPEAALDGQQGRGWKW